MSWQLPTSWSPQGGRRDLAPPSHGPSDKQRGEAGMLLLTRQNGHDRGDRGRGGEVSAWAVACPCRQVPDTPPRTYVHFEPACFPHDLPPRACALAAVTSCSGISPERHPLDVRPPIPTKASTTRCLPCATVGKAACAYYGVDQSPSMDMTTGASIGLGARLHAPGTDWGWGA